MILSHLCDLFQMVLGTNQPVVIFTQQPYFSVPQVDPMVTVNTAGENTGFETSSVNTAALEHIISVFVFESTVDMNLVGVILQI